MSGARLRHVLIVGGGGLLGRALAAADWPEDVRLHLPGRAALDLTDPDSLGAAFAATRFDGVVNAAAFTDVDGAEDAKAAAFAVNAEGAGRLAEAARRAGAALVHISTDYVFDGAGGAPYAETAPTAPLNVYGQSKLEGERAVLAAHPQAVVLRTAWLVGATGRNFLTTMLGLRARETVRVVADQRGGPTAAPDLAQAVARILTARMDAPDAPGGVWHFTNAGEASWAELAEAVFQAAGGPRPRVEPISTADWPTRARRPADSRLDCTGIARDFGLTPRPWREAVGDIVRGLGQDGPMTRPDGAR